MPSAVRPVHQGEQLKMLGPSLQVTVKVHIVSFVEFKQYLLLLHGVNRYRAPFLKLFENLEYWH